MKLKLILVFSFIFCESLLKTSSSLALAEESESTAAIDSDPGVNDSQKKNESLAAEVKPQKASKKKKSKVKHKRKGIKALSPGTQQDPDFNQEEKFHSIYKDYNENPTNPDIWSAAVTRRAELYPVQKGDSLWTISKTLFDDPFFWTKIWSMNASEIVNPHEINPSQEIQFIAGNVEAPPSMGLANPGKGGAAEGSSLSRQSMDVDSMISAEIEIKTKIVENISREELETIKNLLPPPKPHPPLLETLPPSIPAYIYTVMEKEKPVLQLRIPDIGSGAKYLTNYVSEGSVEEIGEIVETESGLSSATDDQFIFIKMNGPPPKKMTAIFEKENLDAQFFEDLKIVEYEAEIEPIALVNESENIYRAQVKKSLNLARVGAKIIPGIIPRYDFGIKKVTAKFNGKIIGGENSNNRKLIGTGELVFLNLGSSNGLEMGDTMLIRADQRLRNGSTLTEKNDPIVAMIKVVKLEKKYSTAIVVKLVNELLVGDYVGKVRPNLVQ